MAKLNKLPARLAPTSSRIATMQPGSWRSDKLTSGQRGYGYKWQVARAAFLRANPLCVFCAKEGRVTAADVVDHSIPHRGDQEIFWDRSLWQSLCKMHHDSDAKIRDQGGKQRSAFWQDGRVIW